MSQGKLNPYNFSENSGTYLLRRVQSLQLMFLFVLYKVYFPMNFGNGSLVVTKSRGYKSESQIVLSDRLQLNVSH